MHNRYGRGYIKNTWLVWLVPLLMFSGPEFVYAEGMERQRDLASATPPRILMVVTSHDTFEGHGMKTGLWLEEFAVPFRIFREAGYAVTVASPAGGAVPVDPRSLSEEAAPENRTQAMMILKDSIRLGEVELKLYEAVFFPGGHGTMFDFPDNADVQQVVEYFWQHDRPVALVCHGPAALVGAHTATGDPIVKGRRVAVFTNEEEKKAGLEKAVPFLLQSRLEMLGASVVTAEPFTEQVVVDGHLITGQNPASSAKAARELLKQLERGKSDNE